MSRDLRSRARCTQLCCTIFAVGLWPAVFDAQSGNSNTATRNSQGGSRVPASAQTIKIEDLEEHAAQYVGKKVRVNGEVQNVLGPRLFTIDEPNWIDLDGETVVLVPAPFAALIRRDAPVVVTGTVRPFVKADIEREYSWFGNTRQFDVDVSNKYVLVASDVTAIGAPALLEIKTGKPVGTSGTSAAVSDVATVAKSNDTTLVGRKVDLKSARVTGTTDRGFWVAAASGGDEVLVMPANPQATKVTQGQNVMLSGVVLEMPKTLKRTIGDKHQTEQIYIYADRVSAAG